jgi:biopolymer transport protein ExbB
MRWIRSSLLAVGAAALLIPCTPAHAATVAGYWRELKEWFLAGGNSMWFILGCSILAVAFTLERLIRLQRKRLVPKSFAAMARDMYRRGQFEQLVAKCDENDSLVARMVKLLVLHRHIPLGDVRTIVGDAASAEFRLHFRRVHPIAVAATVAPLLGLFGTVTGMISAFDHFKDLGQTGDPAVFSGDISLALITTEAGLLVAIPSLAVWHWFRNRTNAFTDELEGIVQTLLVEWWVEPAQAAILAVRSSEAKPAATATGGKSFSS